jgi:excisionase family DNA binding protein
MPSTICVQTNPKPSAATSHIHQHRETRKASTVRAWLAKRKLPRVNCGRAVRIPASAVEEFIERNTIPAKENSR